MNKGKAYLEQAKSDFQVFELLAKADVPECHPLHYLQMATEKIAKAVHEVQGQSSKKLSHVAFSRLPYLLKRNDVGTALGWKNPDAYKAFLTYSRPIFWQIEGLNPKVAEDRAGGRKEEAPNVEYPWKIVAKEGTEDWFVPSNYSFRLLGELQRTGNAAKVRDFVRSLIERFEAIFR